MYSCFKPLFVCFLLYMISLFQANQSLDKLLPSPWSSWNSWLWHHGVVHHPAPALASDPASSFLILLPEDTTYILVTILRLYIWFYSWFFCLFVCLFVSFDFYIMAKPFQSLRQNGISLYSWTAMMEKN